MEEDVGFIDTAIQSLPNASLSVSDGPSYPFHLIGVYVAGKVENRIWLIYNHVNNFLEENIPIVESIYVSVQALKSKPFRAITRKMMEDSLVRDRDTARKGLSAYNRAFGRVDLHLGLMTSNFKLKNFLIENGVPEEQVKYFQEEVRLHWAATYGKHVDRINILKELLDKLRATIQEEVRILEEIQDEKYLDAWSNDMHLHQLLEQERELLRELRNTMLFSSKEVKEVRQLLKTEVKKVKAMLVANIKYRGKEAQGDWESRQTKLQKAVILLIYLIGYLSLAFSFPINMVKDKVSWVIEKMAGERLSHQAQNLIGEVAGLATSPLPSR
jgi:hypothetical protein